MFLRKSLRRNGVVTISSQTKQDSQTSPTDAYAAYRITSAGAVETKVGTAGSWTAVTGDGFTSFVNGADWEVLATVTSGALSTGPVTRVDLATTRTWECSNTSNLNSEVAAIFTLDVYPKGGLSVVDTATIDLGAEVVV